MMARRGMHPLAGALLVLALGLVLSLAPLWLPLAPVPVLLPPPWGMAGGVLLSVLAALAAGGLLLRLRQAEARVAAAEQQTELLGQSASEVAESHAAQLKALEAERDTHQQRRALLEQLVQLAVCDADGRVIEGSAALALLSGRAVHEQAGLELLEGELHPPAFWAQARAQLHDGRPWQARIARRRPDGEIVWWQLRLQPLGDEPLRWLALGSELTPLMRQLQQQGESLEGLQAQLDGQQAGGWSWQPEGDRVRLDRRARSLIGLPPEGQAEIDGPLLRERFHAEDLAAWRSAVGRVLRGQAEVLQLRARFSDGAGGWHWLELRGGVARRDAEGAVLQLAGALWAAQQEHQQVLASALAALQDREALGMAQAASFSYLPETGQLRWGEGALGLLGLADGAVPPRQPLDQALALLHVQDREPLREALRSGVAQRLALRALQRSGGALEVRLQPRAEGRVAGVLLDVSAAQALQREASEQLQAAGQAGEHLMASLVDDIRAPLRVLADESDEAAELLERLDALIDAPRLQAGKLQPEALPFSLTVLLRRASSRVAEQARVKGLGWVLDLEPGLPGRLLGDGPRLQRVLHELLANALRCTASGELQLRLRRVPAAEGHAGLFFEVRDSGSGLADEDLEAIFERSVEGGLQVCRRLLGLMGSELHVNSRLGRGSCFSFRVELPVLEELPVPAPAPEPPAPLPSGLDLQAGLKRFQGRSELYLRTASRFAAQTRSLPAQLRACMATRSLPAALEALHGFKAVAATLGSESLAQWGREGEQRLREGQLLDGDWIGRFATALDEGLPQLLAALQSLQLRQPAALN